MKGPFYRGWKIVQIPINVLGSIISLLIAAVLLQAAYKVISSDADIGTKVFFSVFSLVGIAVFAWMNISIWKKQKDRNEQK